MYTFEDFTCGLGQPFLMVHGYLKGIKPAPRRTFNLRKMSLNHHRYIKGV